MAANSQVEISFLMWRSLVNQLVKQGGGRRESGAFLLGKSRRIEAFLSYAELDPTSLKNGHIEFHARGYSALWDFCAQKGLKVLADIHTHPTSDVRQSFTDQDHPMVPVKGHIALILPRFGRTSKWSMAGVGMHVFQGNRHWESFTHVHPDAPIKLSIW